MIALTLKPIGTVSQKPCFTMLHLNHMAITIRNALSPCLASLGCWVGSLVGSGCWGWFVLVPGRWGRGYRACIIYSLAIHFTAASVFFCPGFFPACIDAGFLSKVILDTITLTITIKLLSYLNF